MMSYLLEGESRFGRLWDSAVAVVKNAALISLVTLMATFLCLIPDRVNGVIALLRPILVQARDRALQIAF